MPTIVIPQFVGDGSPFRMRGEGHNRLSSWHWPFIAITFASERNLCRVRCQTRVGEEEEEEEEEKEEEESLNEGIHNGGERMENVKRGHVAVEEVFKMGELLMAI